MDIRTVIAFICIGIGTLFMIIAALGIYKLPDFYTRLHGAGVGDTLGALLITAGMIILTGVKLVSIKILIVFLLLMLTNPLGTNLIMIAAVQNNNYQRYNSAAPRVDSGENSVSPITDDGGENSAAPRVGDGGEEENLAVDTVEGGNDGNA